MFKERNILYRYPPNHPLFPTISNFPFYSVFGLLVNVTTNEICEHLNRYLVPFSFTQTAVESSQPTAELAINILHKRSVQSALTLFRRSV